MNRKCITNDIVARVLSGDPSVEKIYERRDRSMYRWRSLESTPVIVKLWRRIGSKARVKRWMHIDAASHEWRNLNLLHDARVRVPRPIAVGHLPVQFFPFSEAIVMEDLGACPTANQYLRSLLTQSDEAATTRFEQQLVELTASIIRAGIIDTDHSLVNILVQGDGTVVRLDLEMGRRNGVQSLLGAGYGKMLGRFLGSYCFSVQPDVDRVRQMAQQLYFKLRPPRRSLKTAQEVLDAELELQHVHTGIRMLVEDVWKGCDLRDTLRRS